MGVVTTLPTGRAFTRADLEAMPDDGRRHELIDGALIVTPAPLIRHQRMVVRLVTTLSGECPDDLEVFVAPLDVALADDSALQPDVLVARRADLTEKDLPTAPVLAVEVLSPNTRRIDETLKKARYEAASCPSYWTLDPDEPSATIWELEDGRYVERAHLVGDQSHEITTPFPVTLNPQSLLD